MGQQGRLDVCGGAEVVSKTSVYLPDYLANKVKELDLSISRVLREALEEIVEKQTGRCSRCGKKLDGGSKT